MDQDRIIARTLQESVKANVAKFNAEDLITKRDTAKAVIAQTIANTLSARNIVVETVLITDTSICISGRIKGSSISKIFDRTK
jgi:uncharacterized membrane protein YqiK